ncbi:Hsp33 family molecular chaperone HslO [Xylella fastidiosa subsp. multiplex]|uniref:Hsp33 family molecular chaperone HslO n=1 Tax=Xylella fastidiosa subsp. multiplex TaxID=644357 RepID=A0A9Q4MKL5_XYLFS|nr:Hsp33 family molecular chaperone HslO [Xylella fastidiosa]ERI60018.1 heat shock protein Hsp33 [Xylella fastidiosa subsp. multiplex Griffin-1]ACA12181.1 heat shock protein HSP33 [Xylella fastidiosa M12]KAJ4851917.1 Hsp33 family molecular chaperone HslO [Xylella fastidiosa subsp. multiplex]MBE0268591.1 Hsp33 family molecular chaperone HslO [Xylella fastidiosa subsp. multiplex]MBE0275365.1 Hsp33 family molecular chaperone HslO [Xylella fastidiosa subsp. multiplex]
MTDHDSLTRFLLPHAVVRGIHVSLNETWSNIQEKTHYPAFVSRLLGEAVVAAALFANHTKVNGRLSVALHSKTALRTLFAECTTSGTLRGTVHMAEDISHSEAPTCLRELDHNALLAITVESSGLNPDELQRHQSLIALDAANLTEAFEIYCRDSEQTPIRILLAAEGKRAAGLLLQKLPSHTDDVDGWPRICDLFDTLQASELLELSGQVLLHRLFHKENPQQLQKRQLRFGCSCSREKVAAMLQGLGENEARATLEANGRIKVKCEFCGQKYHFSYKEIDALFP